jgi:hypothetical protein
MAAEYPSKDPNKDPNDDAAYCDPATIDSQVCTAKRIERQAEVSKEGREKTDPKREQFKAAKDAYTTAYNTAKADLDAAGEQLEQLRKDLGCRLSDESKNCLHEAWEKVRDEIEACGTKPPGCREFDCEFDDEVAEDETQASLAGRIQSYRQRARELGEYFDTLIERQTSLPEQAAQVKQAVEALASDAAADTTGKDALKLYARAIILRWTLKGVLGGFPTIQSYLDCLCRTLTCQLKAWAAIVTLEGAMAERKCKDDAEQERCDELKANPVEVLLDRYAKDCAHCDPKPKDKDNGYGSSSSTATAV